jgi:hypothetical protein
MRIFRALLLIATVAGTVRAEELNFAAGFGWKGHVDTDLTFAEFFPNDHTITLRFLAQYTMTGEAPMVSINGSGKYALGFGSFLANSTEAVKLELAIGSSVAFFHFGKPKKDGKPIPFEGEWHTLAVVRKGSTFKVFLDGKKLTPESRSDLVPSAGDLASLSGKVRLGRQDSGEAQFYGFLDDVAVFRKALTNAELDEVFKRDRLRKQNAALDLTRAWTFDRTLPGGGTLPPAFAHDVTFHEPAYKALVSQKRESKMDAKFLPPPFHETVLHLPFTPGESWKVIQGNEGLASHSASGAFSWDFVKDDPQNPLNNIATCGTKVYTAAAGTIIDGCDLGDPKDAAHLETGCAKSASQFADSGRLLDGYDEVQLRHAPDEIELYLHIQEGSLREAYPNHADEFISPVVTQPPLSIGVPTGHWIARAGTRGVDENGKADNCHLHFSVGTSGDRTTFPVAFTNYEYFEKGFARWLPIDRGIPLVDQWIRRPPAEPKAAEASCVCKGGHKAGPGVKAGSAACLHICRAFE